MLRDARGRFTKCDKNGLPILDQDDALCAMLDLADAEADELFEQAMAERRKQAALLSITERRPTTMRLAFQRAGVV